MNFNIFCVVFVFAWLAQLYTSSEEKTDSEVKSGKNLEIILTTPVEDYKPVQAFQHFVYPKKYSIPMSNNTLLPRNITLDKINYNRPSSSTAENRLRVVDDPSSDYRQNYPNSYYNTFDTYQSQQGFQPHFLNQGNSMMHLVDPLFLMATLAFVVFLINSILGLVNKLNLPIIGGGSKRDHLFNELDDGERDRMNDEILDEIENVIKNALFEFKKHLN